MRYLLWILLAIPLPANAGLLNDPDHHPRYYRVMAPARAVWRGVVWLDKKTEPLDPLFKVASRVGALSSCAVPFLFLHN